MRTADGGAASEYECSYSSPIRLIPFVESTGGDAYLVSVHTVEMVHKIDPAKRHTVSILYCPTADGFAAVCGETFLTGIIKGGLAEAKKRAKCAVNSSIIPESVRQKIEDEMITNFGVFNRDSGCSFWKNLHKASTEFGCKHVEHVLANLRPDFRRHIANDLYAAINDLLCPASIPSMPPVTLFSKLQTITGAAVDKKIPVRLEGPKGGGKTYAVRELSKEFAHCEEVGGFAGMESFDFLGGNLPFDGGKLVWMDGPVTAAFRSAVSVKTLLFIDEWMQVPRRERGVFLNSLTPHAGYYRLRTGRPIVNSSGIASMEVLTCPVANLSVIVATNSGSDYGLEEDCPALAERFVTIVHTPTDDFVKSVLVGASSAKGFPAKCAESLIRFMHNTVKLRKDNLLDQTPSLRLLVRAVEMAPTAADLQSSLRAQFPTFLGRTPEGLINPVHNEQASLALENAFK